MKASTLMLLQFTSLLLMIGCALYFMERLLPTIIFIAAFATFAACSIYIGRHEKELTQKDSTK